MSEKTLVEVTPSLSPPTVDEVCSAACAASFGSPLVENGYRGLVAEIIIWKALAPDWHLCSGGWNGWDLQHMSGCRLEVKQSAARQTWAAPKKPKNPSFGIPEKTGYYENGVQPGPRRPVGTRTFMCSPTIPSQPTGRTIGRRANGNFMWSPRVSCLAQNQSVWRR